MDPGGIRRAMCVGCELGELVISIVGPFEVKACDRPCVRRHI